MSRTVPPKLRFEMLRRDNFTCQYCGGRAPHVELQVDHIDPWSKGGRTVPRNLITACRECNAGKRDSEGVTSDPVAITQLAQEITDYAVIAFGKSCDKFEMFALTRRILELRPHCRMDYADSIGVMLEENSEWEYFAALLQEQIESIIDIDKLFDGMADQEARQ